jgi:hypothetical protein
MLDFFDDLEEQARQIAASRRLAELTLDTTCPATGRFLFAASCFSPTTASRPEKVGLPKLPDH